MDRTNIDVNRALAAALAAGTAYQLTAWADSELSSHPFNDLKLVGQVLTTRSPTWIVLGLAGHYTLSIIMSMLYAGWAMKWLPGPGWLKGALFLQLENALLYPGAVFIEPIHAGMRSGQVPTVLSWKSFWGQVLRHLVFGLVLGLVYNVPSGRKAR